MHTIPIRLKDIKLNSYWNSQLRELIQSYGEDILGDDIELLHEVLITQDKHVPEEVNHFTNGKFQYSGGNSCAIAGFRNGKFRGLIILTLNDLQPHPQKEDFNIRATLVEELLHIHSFIDYWNIYGHLYYEYKSENVCADLLMPDAFYLLEEYVAGRRKAEIFKNKGSFSYGLPIPEIIDKNILKLANLIVSITKGTMTADEANSLVHHSTKWGIWDPLSRDASRATHHFGENSLNWDMKESKYFEQTVKPYWKKLQKELTNGYESSPEIIEILQNIITILKDFHESLGIEFQPTADGSKCEIRYNDRWASQFLSEIP